ncbi:MAG: dTDP-4-dehydrorhamnose 3,5-epimerase family protein [Chthoniobacterales bacterium]|nr:dTDP-4-dehydrorhamnose 3,5-epimerase family protein [Chthoniobacterales bacterium]
MPESSNKLWCGLSVEGEAALGMRDYDAGALREQLAQRGMEAGQLLSLDRAAAGVRAGWIPGVEVFPRTIFPQRHRGSFGEFARRDAGLLATIGLWPSQWAAARMFAQTAKGFHIHPPWVPEGIEPAAWLQRLFVDEPENYAARPYAEEQWDVMFFVQGVAEMILRDLRAGMPSRTMRLWVDGDNHRGNNNVAVVIPPGVAHAIRVEGSEDLIMVYGTSVSFNPEFEGRIASEVELATLPPSWQKFLER